MKATHSKALHWTAITLHSIAAGKLCRYPSRLNGPHDIARLFDDVSTGFHLKEWMHEELVAYMRKVGFKAARTTILPWPLARRSSFLLSQEKVPVWPMIPGERPAGGIGRTRIRLALVKLLRLVPIYHCAEVGWSSHGVSR